MLNAVEKVFINSSRSIFFFLIKQTNAKMISYKIQNINDYGKDVSEIKRASIKEERGRSYVGSFHKLFRWYHRYGG